nr:hypothetical protein [Tanacetum cinerariifolium]
MDDLTRKIGIGVTIFFGLCSSSNAMVEDLGFKDGRILLSHFRIPGKSLDEGLAPLMSNEDVLSLLWRVPRDREIEEKGVLIEEIVEDDDVENKHEASTSKVANDVDFS